MGEIVLFSFASALNPTLLAATTGMLLVPRPERLMLGYWLGAMVMSVASGLLVIYALRGTGVVGTTRHTLTPVEDLALAVVALTAAALLGSGVVGRARERRARHRDGPKKDPKWQQRVRSGTSRTTFVLGMALSLPGATYLLILGRLTKLDLGLVVTTLVLIASNLIQLVVVEFPMVAFARWPDRTPTAIENAKTWLGGHGRTYGAAALVAVAGVLAVRGLTRAW